MKTLLYTISGMIILFSILGIVSSCQNESSGAATEYGCQTGAVALGNAYVRVNPFYSHYFGNLESYVVENRDHFVTGGDSIQCANALSKAIMNGSIKNYEKDMLRLAKQVNKIIENAGLSQGSIQNIPSKQLKYMPFQLNRFARVLPFVAAGKDEALYTPSTEFDKEQIAAKQLFDLFFQGPMAEYAFREAESILKEAANLEYKYLVTIATNLN